MDKRFEELIEIMLAENISDLHLTLEEELKIEGRVGREFVKIPQKPDDAQLLYFLQYLANLDLSQKSSPQSGSFEYTFNHNKYAFRFAFLQTSGIMSGVLRILNFREAISLNDLVLKGSQRALFKAWTQYENGLILLSGPTGSGKTTTAYSLLASMKSRKVYTLEDPIEIYHQGYVQIQVNPAVGLDYDNGIKQLLRHDPDVIMIGEIRDEKTARMALRCALTGHLVITTIHASSCIGAISRLNELGISKLDQQDVVKGIANQRLVTLSNGLKRVSLYETFSRKDLEAYFNQQRKGLPTFAAEIAYAYQKHWITLEEAKKVIF